MNVNNALFLLVFAVVVLGCASTRTPAAPSYATLIAHRGESADAPENTLPAYRMAVDRGFGFECDVYLSKDGRIFTFHDSNLKRTTGGANSQRCTEASWEETVSKVDVGNWGKWKGSKFAGTRPALFEEVIDLARDGRWIYVEVKSSSGAKIVPYLKRALAGHPKANPGNVLFITFSQEICAALKREMPEYRVYWLTDGGAGTTPEGVIKVLQETAADGVDIGFDPKYVTRDFVRKIEEAGFEVHVWTVDNLDTSLVAFANGARTVTTNCAKRQLDQYERLSAFQRSR